MFHIVDLVLLACSCSLAQGSRGACPQRKVRIGCSKIKYDDIQFESSGYCWLLELRKQCSQSTALRRILLQALLQMCCIFLLSLFLRLDLKSNAMWWDIWSMMNSYQDVPYIYQNNLLNEKSKIMCVRNFSRNSSLIVAPRWRYEA